MITRILFFIMLLPIICLAGVPEQRLAVLTKGISIPHWYWMRNADTLIDHYITEGDILTLKKLGFLHVRIPFEMEHLSTPRIIAQLKKDIQRFTDHQIGVIISAFGHQYNRDLIATPLATQWLERLCAALKDTPPGLVFIQIANEPLPDVPDAWSTIQDNLIQTARNVLPDHTVITSVPLKFGSHAGDWNMIRSFQLMTPSDDKNVVYAFHFYEPNLFTHQGASWDRHTRTIKHLGFPTDKTNAKKVISKLPNDTPSWIIQSIRTLWNKQKLDKSIAPILQWRETHQRPVMVTEFGVYSPHVDLDSRLRWLADVVSIFKDHNFPWTIWDYDAGFGLFKKRNGFRELDTKMAEVLGLRVEDLS